MEALKGNAGEKILITIRKINTRERETQHNTKRKER